VAAQARGGSAGAAGAAGPGVSAAGPRYLEPLAPTALGRYVLAHMPPAAQAMRAAGDVLTGWGCWQRRVPAVLAGVLMIAAGWSFGLSPASQRRDDHTGSGE
jgi:hypothetical protein